MLKLQWITNLFYITIYTLLELFDSNMYKGKYKLKKLKATQIVFTSEVYSIYFKYKYK